MQASSTYNLKDSNALTCSIELFTSRLVTWIGPGIALHAHLKALLLLLLPLGAWSRSVYTVGIDRINAVLLPLGLQPLVLVQLQITLLQSLLVQLHVQVSPVHWRQRFDGLLIGLLFCTKLELVISVGTVFVAAVGRLVRRRSRAS